VVGAVTVILAAVGGGLLVLLAGSGLLGGANAAVFLSRYAAADLPLAGAQHDRVQPQPVLVDQVGLPQRLGQLAAADDHQGPARLPLQVGDRSRHVAVEDRGARPVRPAAATWRRRTWGGCSGPGRSGRARR
jgi:hypothetical protein